MRGETSVQINALLVMRKRNGRMLMDGAIMFKPVEGWKARKTTLKGYRHENTSYHVIKCPEYKEDE